MIGEVRAFLNARAEAMLPATAPIAGGIVVGADKDPAGKATLLLFDRTDMPIVVAKVARRPEGESSLRSEAAALTELWATGISTVERSVPRLLAIERIAGRLTLITSAVPGRPMTTSYYQPGHVSDPGLVREDFRLAGEWLGAFHRETRRPSVFDVGACARWVTDVLDRYRARVRAGPDEARLFDDVRDRANDLLETELPLVGVHGDYAMGNLLLEGGRVSGVVDWEFGAVTGLPFRDIYKFPTSYGFYLDRACPGRDRVPGHPGRAELPDRWRRFGDWPNLVGFAYSFFGRGWFPEQVRDFVSGHLDALGIPRAVNAVFFPIFLAEQAMALEDPGFREGYRSLLCAFGEERESTWLWESDEAA